MRSKLLRSVVATYTAQTVPPAATKLARRSSVRMLRKWPCPAAFFGRLGTGTTGTNLAGELT